MILWIIIIEARLQDISDDGAIYMLPSAYSCIGITYNKTLLEEHGWSLPKSFTDLENLAAEAKEAGVSAVPGSDRIIRVMVFNICAIIADTAFSGTFQGKQWQKDHLTGKANVRDAQGMKDCMEYIQKWKDMGMFTRMKRILEAMRRPEKNLWKEILYFCWEVKRVLGKQMIQEISLV